MRPVQGDFYDYAFVGAGGAALNLIFAMHQRDLLRGKRILILDKDAKESNDRTWCFWSDQSDAAWRFHRDIISHQWDNIALNGQREEKMDPYQYCHTRSADFYKKVKAIIHQLPGCDWLRYKVRDLQKVKNGVLISTGSETYSAHMVFDSRPPIGEISESELLWQSFVGWRVKTSPEVFNTRTCTLMDFEVPQMGETQFMYLLPTAGDESLVELTRFGRSQLQENEAIPVLENYLKEMGISDFSIVEKEIDKIPMTLELNPKRKNHFKSETIIPLGTRAGTVKGSTGFAFKAMCSHAEALALAMEEKKALPTAYHPPQFRLYDRLLLKILSEKPAWGKPIFKQLFENLPLKTVFRFLDEKTSLPTDLKVMSKVPWTPFLQALGNHILAGSSLQAKLGRSRITELVVLALTLILVGVESITPLLILDAAPWLLLAGLIFPGIPHGAVDHAVALKNYKSQPRQLLIFSALYLGIMVLIAMLWWWSPLLGLVIFLLYSAWHFGQTDLEEWGEKSKKLSLTWGLAALGFLLFSHYQELAVYLETYKLPVNTEAWSAAAGLGWGISSLLMIYTGIKASRSMFNGWLITSLILVFSTKLPLLLAFALYFVGCHSTKGWLHLQEKLDISHGRLLKLSAPFSLGAFAIGGLSMWWAFSYFQNSEIWAWVFVFIAAISAPHVGVMHRLYRRRKK